MMLCASWNIDQNKALNVEFLVNKIIIYQLSNHLVALTVQHGLPGQVVLLKSWLSFKKPLIGDLHDPRNIMNLESEITAIPHNLL